MIKPKCSPVVTGCCPLDAAGAVGAGVDHLSVGDAVIAVVTARQPTCGTQAEMIVVLAASVVATPDGIAAIAAAPLPMNGLASESTLAGHWRSNPL